MTTVLHLELETALSGDPPLVTILTPVYNGDKFLAECIESVLKQTYWNFEYIIVNNCSTDRSLEVAVKYAARDKRIRIHNNERFVPVIDNHNIAFGLMSPLAKYCKVVSADDLIFSDCILQMVNLAEANPTVGYVGGYQLSLSIVRWQGFKYPTQIFDGVDICREILRRRQVFVDGQPIYGFGSPTSLLYRADLIRQTSDFYPNLSPHSDTSACLRDLRYCDFGFVYQILSLERTHKETQTSASINFNRYASAYIDDLVKYGSYYLDKEEVNREISRALQIYHRYLVINVLRFPDNAFWKYHVRRLEEIGYPIRVRTMSRTIFGLFVDAIVNPGKLAENFRDIWKH